MSPIEIRAVRASKNYPFTQSLILKRNIEKNNLGQDIPFLLNQVPGTVVNSDAGNGVGYTGLRIRGTDASRINFTLNGIAYNDAEKVRATVESALWADEVVVVDSWSTDGTAEIAASLGARVVQVAGDFDAAPIAHDILVRMAERGLVKMSDFRILWKSRSFPPGGLSMAHDLAPALQQKIRECSYAFRYTPEMVKSFQGADRWLPIDYRKDWEIIRKVAQDSGQSFTATAFEKEKARASAAAKK